MELLVITFMAVCGGILGMAFLLVGALLAGAGLSVLREVLATRRWQQVFAAVESSTVETVSRREKTRYRPVVVYAYGTATGTFSGKRIGFAERLYSSAKTARKVAERYPAGTTVMARCNPDDPTEAVLEIRWVDGLGLLLFGLLCWVFPVGAAFAIGLPWAVSAAILLLLLAIPGFFSLRQRSKLREARRSGNYPRPGQGTDADVAALAARGDKLLAIKLYRELHGGGLKAAKAAVEHLRQPGKASPETPSSDQ